MLEQDIKSKTFGDAAKAITVQLHQQQAVGMRAIELRRDATLLNEKRDVLDAQLEDMLAQAEALCQDAGLDPNGYIQEDVVTGELLVQLSEEELESTHASLYTPLELISCDPPTSWEEYISRVENYAGKYGLSLTGDILARLLTQDEMADLATRVKDDYTLKEAHCDQYEYALAAFCGVATGLIDVFFVGKPGDSKLGEWVDKRADDFVQAFAQKMWDKDSPIRDVIKEEAEQSKKAIMQQVKKKNLSKEAAAELKKNIAEMRNQKLKDAGIPYNQALEQRPLSLQQCIQYLESKYKVCYDATSDSQLVDGKGKIPSMNPKNHHLYSLGHAPDLIGLFFSILDQFTGEGSYVSNGKVIHLKPVPANNPIDRFELRGTTLVSKLFCGFSNWLGHCISDLVGSNTTRADPSNNKRGSGLPPPGFELFQFVTMSVGKGENEISIAQLSLKVFESGYDARFYATASIPVILNDLLVRLCFTIKRHFYNHLALNECIPLDIKVIRQQPELRRMLLVSQGTFCVVDFTDAGIKSRFEPVEFVLHLNFPAWKHLAFSGLIEIRRHFDSGALDLVRLDEDLEREWLSISAGTPRF